MLRGRAPAADNGSMSRDKPVTVVLVSGGSGGHLMPAMALAECLKPSAQCLFLSTRRPVDQTLAKSSQDPWVAVDLRSFTPLWKWLWPPFLAHQLRVVGQVRVFFRRSQPDVVVGFGGYLSAVGVFTARMAGIPTVIHEQNVMPSRANRWLAGLADAVAVSFPESQRYLNSKARVTVTGNPIRFNDGVLDRSAACAVYGLNPARSVVLVLGGSQGSQAVNTLTLAMWKGVPAPRRRDIQVLHMTGDREAASVKAAYRQMGMGARVYPFLRDMHSAFSAATVAISRAGATGIAEMVALKVPAVLIPYPYAGAHQRANARWMKEIGGAVILEERGLAPGRMWGQVSALLDDPALLQRMRDALRANADGSAGDRLRALVLQVAA